MSELKQKVFVCIDCETTGLDPCSDRIIEVGCACFTFGSILSEFESLIDPECDIPEKSLAIHKINSGMLQGKPKIPEILPKILEMVDEHIIVGHGISFDIEVIANAAKKARIPCNIQKNPFIDTLRLARHYGDSPTNSLEYLAGHFNVPFDEKHRAMADVKMNIEVFKHLASRFRSTEEIFQVLSKPIKMKNMPLGKYKGRPFSEIPLEYLLKASAMQFDQDLLYSIRLELKKRKKGDQFFQATNPFAEL